MSDGDRNPYAPPAEPIRAFGEAQESGEASEYESERRGVALCIGLTFLTAGFYPTIWLIKRRPFLDRLDSSRKLGELLPIFVLVTGVLSFGAAFSHETASVRPLLSLVGGISTIIANFRVLNILRSDSARTGRFLEFSTLGTFFFGIYYLQYKINQLADQPARVGRPKRRKKRKKARLDEQTPVEEAPAEVPPPGEP